MDWKTELAEASTNIGAYRTAQAETAAGFTALHRASMAAGAIGAKEKELIALSIGIAKQCIDCIGFHVQAAAAAGATRAEIEETVNVCVMMGGGPSFMYGVKAIEAFDQLCAD
ncbi:carboxymuconolactone decarboxylase family protein [Actibacterium lipolyticum]|uniref:Carboxymuconolactone decarboxylase family protein n=1 Tax=Actibacterium lipolyticum TaxID=1524263 RepID=A0A238KGQ2_9RHOB|nr:carboxymuconolactone decarboxylase family protein [Actibacterium lipolyticum]SMX41993.1 Carboxymuconolactone decarboxylase family protein [Actibacterium lipolyticum]